MTSGDRLRIMLTNDDGIDSVGLHVLAEAMRPFGDIVIIAPDQEFSGAGAAIGAIWENMPEVHEAHVEGFDECWSVSGPPALCMLFARLGAFGAPPDLVVSGINPGANVGRSVYHSGTIGAALTGRNGGINGVAVSQSVTNFGVEGQAWGDVIAGLRWETAAAVAAEAVEAIIATPPAEPSVLNINVPDVPLDELKGWEWTQVGQQPPRSMTEVKLTPKPGHTGSYSASFDYGDPVMQTPGLDTAAVSEGKASFTWLSRISALDADPALEHTGAIDARLADILPGRITSP